MSTKRPTLLRMTTPTGPGLEIAYHTFGPASRPGGRALPLAGKRPMLALVAGIHGNELNGIFALARLAGWLQSIQKGKEAGRKLTESVLIVPAVNILGLHTRSRLWPFDKTDINRMFPGHPGGETTQRIAAALLEKTRAAKIRIDIHSSNLEFEELPQVRLYGSQEAERATARLLGLPAIIECPVNKTSVSTLLHAWKEEGGQNFVVQAGNAGEIQMHHCDKLYHGLVNLVVQLGIVTGGPLRAGAHEPEESSHTSYFKLHHTVSLVSEKAGLFVPRMELGRWIEKGELLGDIYDGFDGHIRSRVRAPKSGMLTGRRRQALLYQGDLLARIQSPTPVPSGADTYLIGQGQ